MTPDTTPNPWARPPALRLWAPARGSPALGSAYAYNQSLARNTAHRPAEVATINPALSATPKGWLKPQ
ncbi:hypothetical protein GA0111570_101308 [Raineyella antarctica]|uniref:Uncharacterized protein n=1 Tax=Raineyella antarctica TaxID=1577474 RepID=A0A1G6GDI6_9ACTN|nr:hypothetical protein GA0111570_101308 [Raineyella antarctica]